MVLKPRKMRKKVSVYMYMLRGWQMLNLYIAHMTSEAACVDLLSIRVGAGFCLAVSVSNIETA